MTEVTYAPPPPPPPPPPPAAPSSSFDFVKPFAFMFEDPKWLGKIFIGGLIHLAVFFVVGIFFLAGYCARLVRNVVEGVRYPLPDWDDLGNYFVEGVKLVCIVFIYIVPLGVIALAIFIPAGLLNAAESNYNDLPHFFGSGIAGCGGCLLVPLGLLVSFWLPAALLMAIIDDRFSAAFEFGRIYEFIRANIGNYVIAFVVYLIARFAAPLGFILLCVGVFLTAFWAMVVATYAYAEVYRLSRIR